MATANPARDAYQKLLDHASEIALLTATGRILRWDRDVTMPPRGGPVRARQLAQIARLTHAMATDPKVDQWLRTCEQDEALTGDPHCETAVNLREWRYEYDRETALPPTLVAAFAETCGHANGAWVQARRTSDFALFRPHLEAIVRLCQEKAACFADRQGAGTHAFAEPWDAIAGDFEPGVTAEGLVRLFEPLRERLKLLLNELQGAGHVPATPLYGLEVPIDQQRRYVEHVARAIGFDFERGRIDPAASAFCTGTDADDVRLAARFQERYLFAALGSTLHEAGHGIYNQGLLNAHFGTPMGSHIGLAIHESQSRTWENHVGRSHSFWRWALPQAADMLGGRLNHLSPEEAFASVNVISPRPIRVEADELTYNLHIMIRFDLERAMLRGDLAVSDLPDAWNQAYREHLNITPPDDAHGCLQDIHWSIWALGYFPTYTLGNLYAAQLFEAAQRDLGDLDSAFAAGEFLPLRGWLNRHIHAEGRRYSADEICRRLTGRALSIEPLMNHLEGKLRPLYGLA